MNSRAARLFVLSFVALGLAASAAPAQALPWEVVTPAWTAKEHARNSATRRVAPRVVQSPLESGVLAQMNAIRRRHGLVALRVSGRLTSAARQHSGEMALRGYFSHSSADGSSFDRRIARFYRTAGARYWSVGENLLWSSPDVDPAGAVEMWMNSPPHRENLLDPRWREAGLSAVHVSSAPGAYGEREVTIVTADFGVRR